MPWGLKRYQETKALHFITSSCCDRLPRLNGPERRDLLLKVAPFLLGASPKGRVWCFGFSERPTTNDQGRFGERWIFSELSKNEANG